MKILVKVLTTIVVLIVFTTAAGLRALDFHLPLVIEPTISADILTPHGFDSDLGITRRVGLSPERRAWDELEAVLDSFEFEDIGDNLDPFLGFERGLAAPETPFATSSQFEQLLGEQPDPIAVSDIGTLAGIPIVSFPTGVAGLSAGQSDGSPLAGAQRLQTSSPTFGLPTGYLFFDPPISQRRVIVSRASQPQAFVSPVPLPPAVLLLGFGVLILGLFRRIA